MSDLPIAVATFASLLWGTVIYRPYVYVFFACFVVFSMRQLRLTGTLAYLMIAFMIAFASEYSATRNGFPFGMYRYFDETRSRELWISNIPFWDSLSFVFLSYFSWRLASAIRRAVSGWRTYLLAGILMMALDVVIDPLTLLGDRWFLGRIYDYPQGGTYFGVTIANFFGWLFVGCVVPFAYGWVSHVNALHPSRWRTPAPLENWAIFGVYAGVFLFNLGITASIGEWPLFTASSIVAVCTLGSCAFSLSRARTQRSREEVLA